MFLRSRWTSHGMYLLALIIATTTVVVSSKPASAACSLSYTSDFHPVWAGGHDSSLSNLEGSSVILEAGDPDPVWHASWFYTMVDNGSKYAQIGWLSTGDDSPLGDSGGAVIFAQWDDTGNGDYDTRYWTGTGWVTNIASADPPSDGDSYEVYLGELLGEDRWQFQHDGGMAFTTHDEVTWSPDRVNVSGEIAAWEDGSPDLGDHFPGNTNDPVSATYSKKKISGTWYDTDMSQYDTETGAGASYLTTGSGDGVNVFDTRCAS